MAKTSQQSKYPKSPVCVYCGDFFECRDHVIPIRWLRVYRDYRVSETVSCCLLCNKLAGDFPATSLSEKALHLEMRYQTKFAKVLALPNWTEDEVSELKGYLRNKIRRNQQLKDLITRKLQNLEFVQNGFPVVEIAR